MNNTAKQIFQNIQYAALATADSQGDPWNTPVFCAYDKLGRIYWSSHIESMHSKNIAQRPQIFIVLYNSKAGKGEGTGLYIKAGVDVLTDIDEIKEALVLLGKRRGKSFDHPEKFVANAQQRLYRATPHKAWINDAEQDADGDFIKDYRIEVSLSNLL